MKARERTALLRQGVRVLDEGRNRITVSGSDEEEVREIAAARLGSDIRVDVRSRARRRHRGLPCMGHMEREEGRLQLRFVVRGDDHITGIEVEEDDQSVVVLATVCSAVDEDARDEMEVPCHVDLDKPLGLRHVIDGVTGLYVPFKNVYAEMEAK